MAKPKEAVKQAEAKKTPLVVSFVNLKGGVGKTALSVNFAAHCGRRGHRTLLIDLDPQTNSTFSCMSVEKWKEHSTKKGTVANLLGIRQHTSAEGKETTVKDVIASQVFKRVDLIPSHLDLFTIDLDMSSEVARETRLRRALKEIQDEYDIVVCDCPPNLTIPTQNALAASTHFVVPVSLDFLSSLGVGLLLNRIKKLSDDLENPLQNAGIVISRVGRSSYFRTQTQQTLRATFNNMVFTSQLTERTSVAESAAKNCSVFGMSDQAAITEFNNFGDELLKKLALP